MSFSWDQKVLFKHCDPAGIVFFPRYFEMMNDCIEFFFDTCVGVPFETLHGTNAVPMAQIETRFVRPSRHGDLLAFTMGFDHIGASSATYQMTAHCGSELRFETVATLVYVNANNRPTAWPDGIKQKLLDYKVAENEP